MNSAYGSLNNMPMVHKHKLEYTYKIHVIINTAHESIDEYYLSTYNSLDKELYSSPCGIVSSSLLVIFSAGAPAASRSGTEIQHPA